MALGIERPGLVFFVGLRTSSPLICLMPLADVKGISMVAVLLLLLLLLLWASVLLVL
jgi:hypothetical protein